MTKEEYIEFAAKHADLYARAMEIARQIDKHSVQTIDSFGDELVSYSYEYNDSCH